MFADEPLGESIYQILPPEPIEVPKLPMHKSKFPGKLPPTASTFGCAQTSIPGVRNIQGVPQHEEYSNHGYQKTHATFGKLPGSYAPMPSEILQKGSKQGTVQDLKAVKKTNPELLAPKEGVKPSSRPAVPRRDERPIMNLVSSKNYVVANAVENILAAPKKTGNEVKDYLHKQDYGQVPQYLKRIKGDIEEEYEYIRQLQEQEELERNSQVRLLTEEEKGALVAGLKAKWEKVNTDYQATTHITKLDTMGKLRRKEQYEAMLQQVEKDMDKLNKRYIFVDTTQ
jgi:hypothetical protein